VATCRFRRAGTLGDRLPSGVPFSDILQTDRVTLRPLAESDIPFIARLRNDEEVAAYTKSDVPFSIEDARQSWERYAAANARDEQFIFVIEAEGESVGTVGIAPDRRNDCGGMGYMMIPIARGQGLCTEAVRAVVDWSFRSFHLHRIEAEYMPENLASARVAEKVGMRVEGIARERFKKRGRYVDSVCVGILRSEWECAAALPYRFSAPDSSSAE